MSTGENIKKFRKEKHLTQTELAKKMGVNQNDIYRWESGKSMPSINYLKKLSTNLGVTVDSILFTEGEKNNLKITDKELLGKIKNLEELPKKDKEAIVNLIDSLTSKAK